MAAVALEQIDRELVLPLDVIADWRQWLDTMFPVYVAYPFSDRHAEFWEWVWALTRTERPRPFIGIWPRGGGKSTSAELGTVAAGCLSLRNYGLYICDTQDQADDHVANIAAMLESPTVERYYPQMARRLVGKYGNSKGWRRERLRTSTGFTVDAMGLDTAARGVKLEEQRPDWIVLDDLDNEQDTAAVTEKKIAALTKKLLPAGSSTLAVLGMQNLVHEHSIFSRLADGRADFLSDRLVSGPHPAVEGLSYEQRAGRYVITGGTATWQGQDIAACQRAVDTVGLSAFLSESQQDVTDQVGGMFAHIEFQHCTWEQVPELVDVQAWCDPAVTNTDKSDSHGIQVDGRGIDGKIYRLFSWEQRATPQAAIELAILKCVEHRGSTVGVETDQGGDTWISVYNEAWKALLERGDISAGAAKPMFRQDKAGAGHGSKMHRWQQMLAAYERAELVHVLGTHNVLERSLKRRDDLKPWDLRDVAYWAWQAASAPRPSFWSA